MSGGSFDYFYKTQPLDESLAHRMIGWLLDHDMPEASFATLRHLDDDSEPHQMLRELWKAVEWYESQDWPYSEVLSAHDNWLNR